MRFFVVITTTNCSLTSNDIDLKQIAIHLLMLHHLGNSHFNITFCYIKHIRKNKLEKAYCTDDDAFQWIQTLRHTMNNYASLNVLFLSLFYFIILKASDRCEREVFFFLLVLSLA